MFSFVNPALLWLLPLLVGPIILHFMKRSIAVNVTFPTIRFLTIGKVPKEGKRRIRDLLLLLLRLLLLALIILAVADPIQKIPKPLVGKDSTIQRVVIAIDSSASMGIYADREKLVRRLDTVFEKKTKASVFTFDREIRESEVLVDSASAVLDIYDRLSSRPLTSNVSILSSELLKKIESIGANKVYLVSDFQKSSWPTAILERLPENVALEFIDVSKKITQNIAIVKAEVRESGGKQRTVLVTLQNFSQTRQTVELQFSDGLQTLKKTVTIPEFKMLNTTFVVARNEAVEGRVRILRDRLDFDDEFSLWMGKFPPVEIMIVKPLKENRDEEIFFLTKALSIRQENSPRGINVTPMAYDLFDLVDLAKVDGLVFTGSLAYLGKSALAKLKTYLAGGGTVLVTPGNAAALQYQKLQQGGLFNCKFNGVNRSTPENLFFVNKVNDSTILSSVFSNPGEGDLFQFIIRKYCRVQSFSPAKDILLSTDGDALLSVQNHQKGQLYVLGFALDMVWSELPISTSFIPVIHQMFKTGQDSGVTKLTIDEYYKIFTGVGNPFKPTACLFENRPIEVNVDRSESGLQKVNFSELRHALTGDLKFKQDQEKPEVQKYLTVSYQKYLILGVLIILLLEVLISLFADIWSFNKTEEI